MNALQEALLSLREIGLRRSLSVAAGKLTDLAFDLRYGTETFRSEKLSELKIDDESVSNATRYQATGVSAFRKLIRIYDLPRDGVFLDVGSGKGRVMMLAATLGFRTIVGIEFSSELIAICEANIRKFRRRSGSTAAMRVEHCNARDYVFRGDECIVFLFHPFDQKILSAVLQGFRRSLEQAPRRAWIVYYYPIHGAEIERLCPPLRRLGEHVLSGQLWAVYGTTADASR